MTAEQSETPFLELARRPQAVIHTTVQKSFPDLSGAEVVDLVAEAKVLKGRALRELADHLYANPDALHAGSAEGPLAMFRLLGCLASRGHPVALPQCTGCGKKTTNLKRSVPTGRICDTCAAKIKSQNCARCGQQQVRIVARRADGKICNACYLADAERAEPCSRCSRREIPVARVEQRPICRRCWDTPYAQCSICGHYRKTPYSNKKEPICNTCYSKNSVRRTCGECGQQRLIARKSKNGQPDLCRPCSEKRRPSDTCTRCDLDRPGRRNSDGDWLCDNCIPRPHQICTRCERSRPVGARLPLGPVCAPCYCWLHDNPAPCANCRDTRVLIGQDGRGEICGPCSGSDRDPRCQSCRQPGRHHTGKKCARCVLGDHLDTLIAGAGSSPREELLPLRQLLLEVDNPRLTVRWLLRSTSAQILRDLISGGAVITHDQLDTLPQGRHELFLRRLLVHAGLLAARNDEIERIPAWLDELLAAEPDDRARLIRPFAHWFVLHRARRSTSRRRRPGTQSNRERIRVALEFLIWLDKQGLDLTSLSQPILDRWLTEGSSRANNVRYFLTWAQSRRLIPKLHVPTRSWDQPEKFLDETERWNLIKKSIQDSSHDLDTRVAAALVLLFGLSVSRIRCLTINDLRLQPDGCYLTTGNHQLIVPPSVAELLEQLAQGGHRRTRFGANETTPQWLFPGLTPGAPLTASGLGRKLNAFGLHTRHARNGALAALATELPAAVLSDLLFIHPITATRWTKLVARDWHAFVATRPGHTAAPE